MADPNSMGMMQQVLASRRQFQAPSGGNMQANYGHLQQAPVMGGGMMQQQGQMTQQRADAMNAQASQMRAQGMSEQQIGQALGVMGPQRPPPMMGGDGQMGIGNFMQGQVQHGPQMGVQGGPQFNPGQMRQQVAAQMMQQGVPYQATMQQQVMQRAPTMRANYGMQQGMDVVRMKQDALKGLAKQPAPTFSAGGVMTRPGVMWRGG